MKRFKKFELVKMKSSFILSHSDAATKDTEVIDINNKLNLKLLFRRKYQRHSCFSDDVFASQIDPKIEYRWSMIYN